MVCRGHDSTGANAPHTANPGGGKRWSPSRGFWLGMGTVLLFAGLLASAGAIAATQEPQTAAPAEAPLPLEVTAVAPKVTPDPSFSMGPASPDAESKLHVAEIVGEAGPASSTSQEPNAVASSWTASPELALPEPAPPVASDASSLAADAEQRLGVRIALEGQDWGPDAASQAANVRAVISAVERLPETITSSIVAGPGGPLTFVSNRNGRTAAGWQPYGAFAMTYYTNADHGPAGVTASNQVVLATGSSAMSIGHEILHAYQFRSTAPERYALALLGDEMRSFMRATGWRWAGTDDQVRAAADDPWDVLNALFRYDGRALQYVTRSGATVNLTPANPLEAFAVAGSVYYTRPAGVPLPAWPEYWAWFDQNLG